MAFQPFVFLVSLPYPAYRMFTVTPPGPPKTAVLIPLIHLMGGEKFCPVNLWFSPAHNFISPVAALVELSLKTKVAPDSQVAENPKM